VVDQGILATYQLKKQEGLRTKTKPFKEIGLYERDEGEGGGRVLKCALFAKIHIDFYG